MIPKKIPARQRWIQACHTVAEFMKKQPGKWLNEAIVILECDDLSHFKNRDCIEYREPDFGLDVTGLATTDNTGLSNLRLLRSGS